MDDADTKPHEILTREPRPQPLAGTAAGTVPVFRDVATAFGAASPAAKVNSDPAPAVESVDRLHPDFLAQLVASAKSMGERDHALDQLWSRSAKPIAEQIRAKFRHANIPDFVGGSYGLLWQKLADGKYDWRRGPFEAWWRRVLSNAATSAWRTAHNPVPLTHEHEPTTGGGPDSAEAALDQITEQLAELRAALDNLAPREELRAQVNYFAVLLLELRRAIVARLRSKKLLPELSQLLPQWNGLADSEVIELLLPWRQAEERLAFRKDLSALGDTWGRLRRLVDAPPHDLGADLVCAQITCTDGASISRDVWYNWKRHVKNKLGELGFPKKWDDLF